MATTPLPTSSQRGSVEGGAENSAEPTGDGLQVAEHDYQQALSTLRGLTDKASTATPKDRAAAGAALKTAKRKLKKAQQQNKRQKSAVPNTGDEDAWKFYPEARQLPRDPEDTRFVLSFSVEVSARAVARS